MKIFNIKRLTALILIVLVQFIFISLPKAYAATSPTLTGSATYSVLGHETVTNTDSLTTTTGDVGVSTGTSITGFPPGIAGGNNSVHLQSNTQSAIDAQADNLSAYGALDQGCTTTYAGTQDLVGLNLVPGVYCADAFTLTGTLTLSGSGVWIFKSASTLITSGTANVVGGDPCNVWWRLVSSATLGTNTSLIGNILALTSITMDTGATLNGRALVQTGSVTLDNNTISGPTCTAAASSSSSSSVSSSTSTSTTVCPVLSCITPLIIESRRIDADSIFISWGPYAGTDKFVIQYGVENGKWLYSTNVTGFSTTLNALPSNQPIWVLISPTDNCSIAQCGVAKLVGGPLLPNTGFAPQNNYAPWNIAIPAGIVMLVSASFVVALKKRTI